MKKEKISRELRLSCDDIMRKANNRRRTRVCLAVARSLFSMLTGRIEFTSRIDFSRHPCIYRLDFTLQLFHNTSHKYIAHMKSDSDFWLLHQKFLLFFFARAHSFSSELIYKWAGLSLHFCGTIGKIDFSIFHTIELVIEGIFTGRRLTEPTQQLTQIFWISRYTKTIFFSRTCVYAASSHGLKLNLCIRKKKIFVHNWNYNNNGVESIGRTKGLTGFFFLISLKWCTDLDQIWICCDDDLVEINIGAGWWDNVEWNLMDIQDNLLLILLSCCNTINLIRLTILFNFRPFMEFQTFRRGKKFVKINKNI